MSGCKTTSQPRYVLSTGPVGAVQVRPAGTGREHIGQVGLCGAEASMPMIRRIPPLTRTRNLPVGSIVAMVVATLIRLNVPARSGTRGPHLST